jgi:hypothetical protein
MLGLSKMLRIGAVAVLLLAAAGCGTLRLDGADNQMRSVAAVSDHAKTVTFREGMVWCHGPTGKQCVRLPEGVYAIEAEDADFLYFRAPVPLDFRVLDRPGPDSQRNIPGGLALVKSFAKTLALQVVAEIYIDAGGQQKMLVQKLGGDFGGMEGAKWKKNFE